MGPTSLRDPLVSMLFDLSLCDETHVYEGYKQHFIILELPSCHAAFLFSPLVSGKNFV